MLAGIIDYSVQLDGQPPMKLFCAPSSHTLGFPENPLVAIGCRVIISAKYEPSDQRDPMEPAGLAAQPITHCKRHGHFAWPLRIRRPGRPKNAIMFLARAQTAHEMPRHASDSSHQSLAQWEIIPLLNLLEASRASPRMRCAPYNTIVSSLARNGQ